MVARFGVEIAESRHHLGPNALHAALVECRLRVRADVSSLAVGIRAIAEIHHAPNLRVEVTLAVLDAEKPGAMVDSSRQELHLVVGNADLPRQEPGAGLDAVAETDGLLPQP